MSAVVVQVQVADMFDRNTLGHVETWPYPAVTADHRSGSSGSRGGMTLSVTLVGW